jgi:hypothetical protein
MISAILSLSGTESDSTEIELRGKGWTQIDQVNCANLRAGNYYEIGNDEVTAEIYALKSEGGLISRLPLPDSYECRKIVRPQFVEEIR